VTTADRPRFDWFGFFAFIIAMVALNIVIGQRDALGWLNPTVIGLALVFGIAAVVFLRVEAGRADGFVDLTLFENRTYAGATLSNFLLSLCSHLCSAFAKRKTVRSGKLEVTTFPNDSVDRESIAMLNGQVESLVIAKFKLAPNDRSTA
jgi:hypothetical protein